MKVLDGALEREIRLSLERLIEELGFGFGVGILPGLHKVLEPHNLALCGPRSEGVVILKFAFNRVEILIEGQSRLGIVGTSILQELLSARGMLSDGWKGSSTS